MTGSVVLQVFFLDFGNTAVVSCSGLRELPPNLQSHPFQVAILRVVRSFIHNYLFRCPGCELAVTHTHSAHCLRLRSSKLLRCVRQLSPSSWGTSGAAEHATASSRWWRAARSSCRCTPSCTGSCVYSCSSTQRPPTPALWTSWWKKNMPWRPRRASIPRWHNSWELRFSLMKCIRKQWIITSSTQRHISAKQRLGLLTTFIQTC